MMKKRRKKKKKDIKENRMTNIQEMDRAILVAAAAD